MSELRVGVVAPAISEVDRQLLRHLRSPVYQGGYDADEPDSHGVAAADRIEQLIAALGTEQAMHRAWRKRAEEAEARAARLEALCRALAVELEKGFSRWKVVEIPSPEFFRQRDLIDKALAPGSEVGE